jgi:hypothetical protein
MQKTAEWYFKTWWTIMARPIYFFARLKEENWQEKSLTFLMISAWILALAGTADIFIMHYVPVGATLVEGITGFKFIVILPVLVTLALVFFAITAMILGGALVVAFGAAFYSIGFFLHHIYRMLGGSGSLNRMLESAGYSSAATLSGLWLALLALMTRFEWLSFPLFRVGFNLVYFLTLIFAYGLWAVMGRRNYAVPKWKAFAGALVPVIILLIFGWAFDKIALSKLEPWITPLK